jgi:spore germination protein KC
MHIKLSKMATVIILIFSILTGCWDSRDVQDKNIVTAVVTDYANGKYSFILEIANIRGNTRSSSSGQNPGGKFSLVKSEGSDFLAARYDLDRKADSPIFLGATRAIVITDRLAEFGMEEYLNRIRGTPDYRKTTDVVTTSTLPEKILNDKPENDISVGFAIENTLTSMNNSGLGVHISVGDALQALAVKKVGFILSQIDFEKDENTFTGYSIFKDAKRIGFVPSDQSKGVVYLLSSHAKFLYAIEHNGNKIIIEAGVKKKKTTPQYEHKKLRFVVELEFESRIMYMSKIMSVDEEQKNNYAEMLKAAIYEDISGAVKTSQKEYKCDYLDFYKDFKISYPQDFRNINWNEAYSEADVEITIDTKLKAAGMSEINPKRE